MRNQLKLWFMELAKPRVRNFIGIIVWTTIYLHYVWKEGKSKKEKLLLFFVWYERNKRKEEKRVDFHIFLPFKSSFLPSKVWLRFCQRNLGWKNIPFTEVMACKRWAWVQTSSFYFNIRKSNWDFFFLGEVSMIINTRNQKKIYVDYLKIVLTW